MLNRRNWFQQVGGISTLFASSTNLNVFADDWPQWRGPQRDGKWREDGLVDKLPVDQIPLRWSVPIGAGYSGPSVADGRVFITDKQEKSPTTERILCFDEADGRLLWEHEYVAQYKIGYAAGPRASISIADDQAFSLGAMGHLYAIDVGSGKELWNRDLNADYNIAMPIWGISASPLVYDDLLIMQIGGTPDCCIVALERSTGKERWRASSDRAQYSAPIVIRQAGHDVVVVWTGDNIIGLAPTSGAIHWQIPFTPSKMPIGVPTPIVEGDRLFVSSFYDGSMMLRVPTESLTAEKLWSVRGSDEKRTEALHSMIGTPIFRDGYLYGVDSYGQLRCLDAADGRRLWEDKTATNQERWGTIHMVEQGNRVWLFNELGELIIAELSPSGFKPLSRSKLIEPTLPQLSRRGGRGVCWSHPAFANRHIFARNDEKLVAARLGSS